MPVWLAPIVGKATLALAAMALVLIAVWLIKRSARRQAQTEAKAEDAKLRAEAARASQEGYVFEKERLERVDPITGKPLPPLGGMR